MSHFQGRKSRVFLAAFSSGFAPRKFGLFRSRRVSSGDWTSVCERRENDWSSSVYDLPGRRLMPSCVANNFVRGPDGTSQNFQEKFRCSSIGPSRVPLLEARIGDHKTERRAAHTNDGKTKPCIYIYIILYY